MYNSSLRSRTGDYVEQETKPRKINLHSVILAQFGGNLKAYEDWLHDENEKESEQEYFDKVNYNW
jgi:hypothetical protein